MTKRTVEDNIKYIMQAKKLEVDNHVELIVALLERIEELETKLANQVEIVIGDKLIEDITEKVLDKLVAKHLADQNTKVNKLYRESELLKQNIRELLGEKR